MKESLYIFFLLALPFCGFSQILVNEIFADNGECCLDDYDEAEDFIEIINLSSDPIDLAGYYFGDLNVEVEFHYFHKPFHLCLVVDLK